MDLISAKALLNFSCISGSRSLNRSQILKFERIAGPGSDIKNKLFFQNSLNRSTMDVISVNISMRRQAYCKYCMSVAFKQSSNFW